MVDDTQSKGLLMNKTAAGIGLALAMLTSAYVVGAASTRGNVHADNVVLLAQPCRAMDTRGRPDGSFKYNGYSGISLNVGDHDESECDIPLDAVGLKLNVVAVDAEAPGFLSINPSNWDFAGGTYPDARYTADTSVLNYVPGQAIANSIDVATFNAGFEGSAGTAGDGIALLASAPTHVVIDVLGWYTTTGS